MVVFQIDMQPQKKSFAGLSIVNDENKKSYYVIATRRKELTGCWFLIGTS